jgi:hypothetical protein
MGMVREREQLGMIEFGRVGGHGEGWRIGKIFR